MTKIEVLSVEAYTRYIKKTAAELSFDYCGIAKAVYLDEDARRLASWLNKGLHGNMQYMENYFDLRVDPCKLVPGAKSVITLLKNYYPGKDVRGGEPKISKYAWGKDYHEVIRQQLKEFMNRLHNQFGAVNGRGFVDSAPVLERSWAVKSGLGWIGKNGNMITKQTGSFFFIAALIIDIELQYDDPFTRDYCGSCTKCIDACPTDAIYDNRVIDGSKCISYFTIELKDALIPASMQGKFDNWMFGCDVCQDVCPWNRFSKPHHEPAFEALPGILNLSTSDWEAMTEASFNEMFKDSPIKRSKWKGIQRNLRFLQSSPGSEAHTQTDV